MLLDWLQRPHVKQWWDNGDDTLAKVAAHYSMDPDETRRFIVLADGAAVGYFQYSRLDPAQVGTDQFLADAGTLSQGLGTRCLKDFVALIARNEAFETISVDPHPENRRAIRCYEKSGFRHDPVRSDANTYFMVREREEAA